jgi:hypothetical protein
VSFEVANVVFVIADGYVAWLLHVIATVEPVTQFIRINIDDENRRTDTVDGDDVTFAVDGQTGHNVHVTDHCTTP